MDSPTNNSDHRLAELCGIHGAKQVLEALEEVVGFGYGRVVVFVKDGRYHRYEVTHGSPQQNLAD